RHRRLAAIPDAFDVDRHRGVPLRFVDRIEAAAMQGAVERGVVDQGIEPAEDAYRRIDHGLRRVRVGDVKLDANAFWPGLGHKLERPAEVLDGAGHEAAPRRGKPSGKFLSEAARRTGDRDDLVLHIQHRAVPKKAQAAARGGGLAEFSENGFRAPGRSADRSDAYG